MELLWKNIAEQCHLLDCAALRQVSRSSLGFTNSRKFPKWRTSLVGSYLAYIYDTWVTSSNPGLASYLAPIPWVTTCATVSQGYHVAFYCHLLDGNYMVQLRDLTKNIHDRNDLSWTLGFVGRCASNSPFIVNICV
jgi:hypothetical protein